MMLRNVGILFSSDSLPVIGCHYRHQASNGCHHGMLPPLIRADAYQEFCRISPTESRFGKFLASVVDSISRGSLTLHFLGELTVIEAYFGLSAFIDNLLSIRQRYSIEMSESKLSMPDESRKVACRRIFRSRKVFPQSIGDLAPGPAKVGPGDVSLILLRELINHLACVPIDEPLGYCDVRALASPPVGIGDIMETEIIATLLCFAGDSTRERCIAQNALVLLENALRKYIYSTEFGRPD